MSAGTLDQRVAQLEQLVAGLQGSEALQPNYLTVSKTAQVGANFTGVINALGLIIPAGTYQNPQAQNEIVWQDSASGAQIATIFAGDDGNGHTSGNIAFTSSATDLTASILDITMAGTAGLSGLEIQGGNSNGLYGLVSAFARGNNGSGPAGTANATILDSAGRSSFMRVSSVGSQQLAAAVSAQTLAFSASSFSNIVTVNHGLGRVPTAVLLTQITAGSGDGFPLIAKSFGWSSSSVNVQAVDTAGATTQSTSWSCLIIG